MPVDDETFAHEHGAFTFKATRSSKVKRGLVSIWETFAQLYNVTICYSSFMGHQIPFRERVHRRPRGQKQRWSYRRLRYSAQWRAYRSVKTRIRLSADHEHNDIAHLLLLSARDHGGVPDDMAHELLGLAYNVVSVQALDIQESI